jgi:hypothetical protein
MLGIWVINLIQNINLPSIYYVFQNNGCPILVNKRDIGVQSISSGQNETLITTIVII